jgi:hypothetical protein
VKCRLLAVAAPARQRKRGIERPITQRGSTATEGLTADNTDGAGYLEQKQTKETKIVGSSERNFLSFVIYYPEPVGTRAMPTINDIYHRLCRNGDRCGMFPFRVALQLFNSSTRQRFNDSRFNDSTRYRASSFFLL